jgi:ATP-dependent DNA helicase RecG
MPTRVLAFRAAARPVGAPVQIDGVAWWRDGESLVPMPQEILRSI